jgi:hypothetical protein
MTDIDKTKHQLVVIDLAALSRGRDGATGQEEFLSLLYPEPADLLQMDEGSRYGPLAPENRSEAPQPGGARRAARQALPQDMSEVRRALCGYERKSR